METERFRITKPYFRAFFQVHQTVSFNRRMRCAICVAELLVIVLYCT